MPETILFERKYRYSLSLVDAVKYKVLVASHERSGTHFLMNSMAANLGYIAEPWLNLDWELGINFFSPSSLWSFFSSLSDQQVGNVIKSHHAYGFFSPIAEQMGEEYRVVYIHRHVCETLASYWRLVQHSTWFEGPRHTTLSEFIRSKPQGGMARYQFQPAENLVQRWAIHVDGWIEAAKTNRFILAIGYHDLETQFEITLRRLAQFLDRDMPNEPMRPSPVKNVVLPRETRLGHKQYIDMYTRDDLQFIRSNIEAVSRNIKCVFGT